jgi:chromosome segregation ATPase
MRVEEEETDDAGLREELDEARATITSLELDRRAARVRIDELEAAGELLETRVRVQRRRLLVLERQLEGANVQPATDEAPTTSWFDRLFGGPSSVRTV